ncbi:MAG: RidA family protein [Oscillospiraceae bacterium]|jgi:2-iminobutanoate/2-iminopropanoate deaminase|nr:RidA family protein [Oscillospiraceae bacterium]
MRIINSEGAPAAIGPYSQAVLTGGLLFVSGQIPLDPETGEMASGGIREQTERVIGNIEAILRQAGAGFEDVVKTACFLSDMGNFAEFNEIYAKHFTGKPARSCVAVRDIPRGALVEIEAVAEVAGYGA